MKTFIKLMLLTASLFIITILAAGVVTAQETKKASDWQFGAEAYMWGAQVDGDTTSGSPVQLDFDDILDSLHLGFMGLFTAQKNKWSLIADVIYLDLQDDETVSSVAVSAELKGWIINSGVGYNLINSKNLRLDVLGGVRYHYLDAELKEGSIRVEESSGIWDGIVGIRGNILLTDKWYLPYHLDVGTGESDFTYQALGGIGYRFSKCEIVAGYRYLSWEYDGHNILDDLSLYGPFAGIKFNF